MHASSPNQSNSFTEQNSWHSAISSSSLLQYSFPLVKHLLQRQNPNKTLTTHVTCRNLRHRVTPFQPHPAQGTKKKKNLHSRGQLTVCPLQNGLDFSSLMGGPISAASASICGVSRRGAQSGCEYKSSYGGLNRICKNVHTFIERIRQREQSICCSINQTPRQEVERTQPCCCRTRDLRSRVKSVSLVKSVGPDGRHAEYKWGLEGLRSRKTLTNAEPCCFFVFAVNLYLFLMSLYYLISRDLQQQQ